MSLEGANSIKTVPIMALGTWSMLNAVERAINFAKNTISDVRAVVEVSTMEFSSPST